MQYENIADNLADIKARAAAAATRAGRGPSSVAVVAAAKTNGAGAVRAAIAAGVDAVGENRVQEMLGKHGEGAYGGAPLHFIGHLQTNKVKQVIGRVDLLQSLDSLRLAEAVSETAASMGIVQNVLVEVNIGGEPNKTGFDLCNLHKHLHKILELPHICVCGLMTIPPMETESRPSGYYFERMNHFFVDIKPILADNISSPILSMGMSGDFERAIEAGATMIRVGTALFGNR